MTTNDIDAIRDQSTDLRTARSACPTDGVCLVCSDRAVDVATHVPALCDEIDQLRAERDAAVQANAAYMSEYERMRAERNAARREVEQLRAELAEEQAERQATDRRLQLADGRVELLTARLTEHTQETHQ